MIYLFMFTFAFVFMCVMLYFLISFLSTIVFGYKEWQVKNRGISETWKSINLKILDWKEQKMQKWFVLIAVIICGLVWMPSMITLYELNNYEAPERSRDVVNYISVRPTPTATPTLSERYDIPEPYYLAAEKGTKTISELRETLKSIKHLHEYEAYRYDCSQMSSYTEWYLENRGFNVSIVAGNRHAWIIVTNIENQTEVHVECTTEPPFIKTNREYTNRHDTIFEACEVYCPAWDWWRER